MPEAATRRVPTVPSAGWMRPLPPALRLILQADAGARAIAATVWGAAFAEEPCRAVVEGSRATLWQGPDEYLLLAAPFNLEGAPPSDAEPDSALVDALERALESVPHSLVDVSHRQFALEVSGPHAAAILSGACPLDLDIAEFPVGMCTRTALAKADIVLWRKREDVFHLEVWRSFNGYVTGLLREIATEFRGE
ncbi:MAG TPA: sarcosine oxidase subunit gamma family protein [Steroidobacteraceae bacterium]|nr:sarcosine oxidase subunit gamma family protein [Steroidobacteraceae bacterium]